MCGCKTESQKSTTGLEEGTGDLTEEDLDKNKNDDLNVGFPTKPNEKIWEEDSVLKILTIGNSFSIDSMRYVYQIAKAAGIENIELGNLYISGCSLQTHLSKARNDLPAYTYYTNNNGEWQENSSYKLADAVKSDNWDYISFQQASAKSGVADTYDDLNALISIVEPMCTNENVQFVWHMTWAYQSDSMHAAFAAYNNNQKTMYSAIVSAVQQKILPNDKIVKIIPNGTAVQNARTSYLGDSLTRDGYHMSYTQGRVIAGVTMVAALAGIDDWDNLDISSVSSDTLFNNVVIESVKNALNNPFEITQSEFSNMEDFIDLSNYVEITPVFYKNQYWNSTQSTDLTGNGNTMLKYWSTGKFTTETLPVGSIVIVADGWQYRAEGWNNDELNSTRPGVFSNSFIVTDDWWKGWTTRAFNISMLSGSDISSYTDEQMREIFKIYIPKE